MNGLPDDTYYGHAGQPSYDPDTHQWMFPRNISSAKKLQPLGRSIVALESSRQDVDQHAKAATDRLLSIHDISRQFPELLPSIDLLPELVRTSEAVTEIISRHDPTVADILAFGYATVLGKAGRKVGTVPIAAVPGGAAGEAVRLVLLTKEELGWRDHNKIKLASRTAKGGMEGWWAGSGSPIQQLVFADTKNGVLPWLAVRYGGSISILHPLLRKDHLPHLDPNHIVTLSTQESGGIPIASVTFNPWDTHQIATLDQSGRWRIWEIVGQSVRQVLWTFKRILEGASKEHSVQDEKNNFNIIADGWGAISWISNANTLLVSSRTILSIHNVKADHGEVLIPIVFSQKSKDWILDVRTNRSGVNQVFVLTSSSVFCLRVSDAHGSSEIRQTVLSVDCLLTWRHFRDSGDISLCLNITQIPNSTQREVDRTSRLCRMWPSN